MKYKEILERIHTDLRPLLGEGNVAEYIPELKKIDPNQLAISLFTNSGDEYSVGDAQKLFSIQSISKVFSFGLAYNLEEDKLWTRVGREPSGNKFDSLVLLENENGIPRNPFINAGALVVTDILLKHFDDPVKEVLRLIRSLSGNPSIEVNKSVLHSELESTDRNYALAYFMKSYNNIESDISKLMEVYCGLCSIEMSTSDLAKSFRIFSMNGINPWTNKRVLSKGQNKRINAVMMTCGLYNAVGDFAYRVGIPAKSGVGGGIAAVIPNEMSIAVWSPALDKTGNSLLGVKALEMFTTITGKSIY